MNLNQYIENLEAMADQGYGEMEVIYSCDNDGNSFEPVHHPPITGHFSSGEFNTMGIILKQDINAVCIN